MRSPHLEDRPRRDGTTGYRVKWEEPDTHGTIRARSATFDDPVNAADWRDALTEHGTAAAAAEAMREGARKHRKEPRG